MVHIYSKDNNLTLELFCSSTLSCESLLIISVIVEQHHRYFRSHITLPKSHLWNPKSSSWLQYQQEAGCFHSQVSSYLSLRHCSELNPPPFSLTSFSLPPFFLLSLPRQMYVVDTEASGNNGISCQWLVFSAQAVMAVYNSSRGGGRGEVMCHW